MQLQPSTLNARPSTPSNSTDSSNVGLCGSTPGDHCIESILAPSTILAVVIPHGSRLTSSLTYSDLSDGYRPVERQPELLRVPDGNNVRPVKRIIQYVNDPDSLAIVLAVPTRRPGIMRPVFGIAHCKLRYVFNDAINWSLTRDRLRFQNGTLAIYTATSTLEGDNRVLAMLPKELTTVEVHADDLNFDAPTVKFVNPKGTIHWLFYGALAFVAGFLFIEFLTLSTTAFSRATMRSAYDAAVLVTARELHHFIARIHFIVWCAGRLVSRLMAQGGLRITAFFQEIQENVAL